MTLWQKADEWTGYALCGQKPDFVIDPETLGPERTAAVVATCKRCPVRPECIEMNIAPVTDFGLKAKRPSNSMWVAGVWLPDADTAANRRELEAKRQSLSRNLAAEYAARPDEVT